MVSETAHSNQSSPDPRVFKIVLLGETGSGKSSVINLLAGSSVADVSPSVEACTKLPRWYQVSLGGREFRFYDTTGFNQLQLPNTDYISPYEQAYSVLRSLKDGIDLVLLCTRKDGINASLRRIYSLVNSVFFDGGARIALVVTNCDGVAEDGWLGRNREAIFSKTGIRVQDLASVLCITTLEGEDQQLNPRFTESKRALEALLQTYTSANIPFSLSPDFLSNRAAVVDNLVSKCLLGIPEAEKLVQGFATEPRLHRIIIFGETGHGKSSVINLVAGKPLADVSSSTHGVTLRSKHYTINTGVHEFKIWDTVGLNEPNQPVASHGTGLIDAIQNAMHLIKDVHEEGGIDLLLFCVRGGRITNMMPKNYVLFHEFLCSRKVPIALVITHLENEPSFEKWWEKEGAAYSKHGINVVAHACVTSILPRNSNLQMIYADKLTESRLSVQALLEGSTFLKRAEFSATPDAPTMMAFVKKVVEFMSQGSVPRLKVKELMKRCEFTQEQAKQLVEFSKGLSTKK